MINKLVEKIKKTGAPIVVGLDPMLNYIHSTYLIRLMQSMVRLWKEQQRQYGSSIRRLLTRLMI